LKDGSDLCHGLAAASEAELSSFYTAVLRQNGTSAANEAAERWLQVFRSTTLDRDDLIRSLRRITINAASLLTAEFLPATLSNQQQRFEATRCKCRGYGILDFSLIISPSTVNLPYP
jgi:hypothetical protein